MTAYFLAWAALSLALFWNTFSHWFKPESKGWVYILLILGLASGVMILLYILSLLPVASGPVLAPYTDLIVATPWYFLPKAAEILVQQIIIAALVLTFYAHSRSLHQVIINYAITFGGGHVLFFFLSGTPTPYATIMTAGAVVSSLFFPYLILRKNGGILYCYAIHLAFYLCLAIVLHVWPPPGFGFLGT